MHIRYGISAVCLFITSQTYSQTFTLAGTHQVLRMFKMEATVVAEKSSHTGPDYGKIPSGAFLDHGSKTFDNARGGNTVRWTDRFNKKHAVVVAPGETITVIFPIPYGGSWIWFQGDNQQERTGFNPAVTWVEATFWWEGNHIRFQSTGHRSEPADPGLWGEIKDRITEVKEIASLGAKTGEEALKIASAAGKIF